MFCEGCPNQGAMLGQINQVVITPKIKLIGSRLLVIADENLNTAAPLTAPEPIFTSDKVAREFIECAIALCPGPKIETQGRIKKRKVINGCGSLAINALEISNKNLLIAVNKEYERTTALLRIRYGVLE